MTISATPIKIVALPIIQRATPMATYRILSWQEIPSQVSAEDDDGEVKLPLTQRLQDHIDAEAIKRGLGGGDDYLMHWRWL